MSQRFVMVSDEYGIFQGDLVSGLGAWGPLPNQPGSTVASFASEDEVRQVAKTFIRPEPYRIVPVETAGASVTVKECLAAGIDPDLGV